jgi:hypothetical protein
MENTKDNLSYKHLGFSLDRNSEIFLLSWPEAEKERSVHLEPGTTIKFFRKITHSNWFYPIFGEKGMFRKIKVLKVVQVERSHVFNKNKWWRKKPFPRVWVISLNWCPAKIYAWALSNFGMKPKSSFDHGDCLKVPYGTTIIRICLSQASGGCKI